MSSSLRIFNSPLVGLPGVQPVSSAVQLASVRAAQTTAALAQSVPGGTALAATGSAGAPGGEVLTASNLYGEPMHLAQLRARTTAACFGPDRDPVACSVAAQTFGAASAQRTSCPSGAVVQVQQSVRSSQSDIDRYFHYPTWVSPVNPSNEKLSSVAITMSKAAAPTTVV